METKASARSSGSRGRGRVLVSVLATLILLASLVGSSQAGAPKAKPAPYLGELKTIEKPAKDAKGWAPPERLPAKGGKPAMRLVEWDPDTSATHYIVESVPDPGDTEPVLLGIYSGVTPISECGHPFETVRKYPGYGGNGEPCRPPGTIASYPVTIHQYANLTDSGKADPYGRGNNQDSKAYVTARFVGETHTEQEWRVVGCPEPYRSQNWGDCQNGRGEYAPITEAYTHTRETGPQDDLAHIYVNRVMIALPHPLKIMDNGDVYLAIDPEIFRPMEIDYYPGPKGNYMWFGNYGTFTIGLHKTTLGFALLDLAPVGNQIPAFKESGVYYVQMFPFLNLLGARSQSKRNGLWEIDLTHPYPHVNPWVGGCNRHGYVGTDELLKCPMDKFLTTPYYTWSLTMPSGPPHPPSSLLPGLEYTAKLLGLSPSRVKGGDWDRDTKRHIEKLNSNGVKFFKADYSHWRMTGAIALESADEYVNAALMALTIEYGVGWLAWELSPPRNIAAAERVQQQVAAMAARADELEAAAVRQGLGRGYPIVRPTFENMQHAPGAGTFAKIVFNNPGYWTQCRIAGCPAPQILQGFDDEYIVVLERGAYRGSPWLDGVGPIKGQVTILEVKGRYGQFVDNAAAGRFQPWWEYRVAAMLRQLQDHVAAGDEMGWKVRVVSTDRLFITAFKNRAVKDFGPGILNKVEFGWLIREAPLIPPPPPPGARPFGAIDMQSVSQPDESVRIINQED